MSTTAPPPPPDEKHRLAAVASRGENLLVDAGAGTGKTTLLVRRLVEMVAPSNDAAPALSLDRIAAVTFTRKAAGELKLRVREKLLSELACKPSAVRRDRLAAALTAADTAFIGTIHGFADRLLRRRPVEARLSPSYEVLEDTTGLVHETFETLLQASEAGTLADELADTDVDPAVASEAGEAIRLALQAEVQVETKEYDFSSSHGLDALFAAFIAHRDVPPVQGKAAPFPAARVKQRVDEFLEMARLSSGTGKGTKFLRRFANRLEAVSEDLSAVSLFREVNAAMRWQPQKMRLKDEFVDDKAGYDAWFGWTGYEQTRQKVKEWVPGIVEDVMGPAQRWLATRLVRAFPAVVALYGKVKARHRAVDQVDLLLMLRDLLASNLEVRTEMQGLFDHVFVDEFQDTDPLQAEIILYLCEEKPVAKRWQDVVLAPGRLTLVGDPKQSIYRFRRADISVYESVRAIVAKGKHRHVPLTANFRSQPALIGHLNDRYDEILGKPEAGKPDFDVSAGTVVNRRLDAAQSGKEKRCVAVLPFRTVDGKAAEDRELEATVLATFLRAQAENGIGYGDVAVLAHSTFNVPCLTAELDRLGVPWSARGGSLYLKDPLHVQFLLALRAIANRDDGIAVMALLRVPFFAVDLADLVRARAQKGDTLDEGILRARAAEEQVRELRRRRFERPPGETARDLLEKTGFGRAVAFGPNGRQRLGRLRELCFEVERVAASEGLDFDAVTARMREWVDKPEGIDPPRPVGGDAVQIMTIHQAKGLEFPVVVWWDARAKVAPRDHQVAWHVSREDGAWAIDIAGLAWEEPEGRDLLAKENDYIAAERRRLVYVAGTRARDLLVLPVSAAGGDGYITNALVGVDSPAIEVFDEWASDEAPAWAKGVKEPPARKPKEAKALAALVEKEWISATTEAGKPRFEPRGILRRGPRAGRSTGGRRSRDALEGPGEPVRKRVRRDRPPRDRRSAPGAQGRSARSSGPHREVHWPGRARCRGRGGCFAFPRRPGAGGAAARAGRRSTARVPDRDGGGREVAARLPGLSCHEGRRLGRGRLQDRRASQGDGGGRLPRVRPAGSGVRRDLVKLGLAKAGAVQCGLLFTGDGGLRWLP